MNPELLRNIWLEITPQRLAAMPAVLFLLFGVVWLSEGVGELPDAAWWTGIAIGVVWGARQAAGAVMGEVAARTWDAQRASALGPAQMALGKLFGATAYAWYGVAPCIAVLLATGGAPADAATLALRTALSHGAALFASLVILGLGGRALVLTSLPHLLGMLAGAGIEYPLAAVSDATGWYGLALEGTAFGLLSGLLLWAWSVVGCTALIARELNVPRRAPAWPAFILFVAAYAAGFGSGDSEHGPLRAAFLALGLLTATTALVEPKSRVEIARLLAGRLGEIPPSIQALAATSVVAVLLGFGPVQAPSYGSDFTTLLPVAGVLFLARDIALIRLLSLRRGGLRGAIAAVVWFAVLYGMLPVLLASAGAEMLLVLFYPVPVEGADVATALALGAPAAQAAILWALLARAVRQGLAPAAPRPA
ncbi:hypothetical protein [Elioraea rosea]|uniref:hypothetical protein n=1 Tax=Elioraea rosea TaxID=2492390 RepID=UPI001184224D|nr:hypothetical protein [Elioraea rosea]